MRRRTPEEHANTNKLIVDIKTHEKRIQNVLTLMDGQRDDEDKSGYAGNRRNGSETNKLNARQAMIELIVN